MDLMSVTTSYKALSSKYYNFRAPTLEIEAGGVKLISGKKIQIKELDIDLTSGYEASGCVFYVSGEYVPKNTDFSRDISKLQIGEAVKVSIGYIKTEQVFSGYINSIDYDFGNGTEAYLIRVECMDAKGLLMKSRRLEFFTEKSADKIVKNILGSQPVSSYISGKQIDACPEEEIPLRANMLTEYELIVEQAEKLGYEFFILQGKVYFREKEKVSSSILKLSPRHGILNARLSLSGQQLFKTAEVRSIDEESAKLVKGEANISGTFSKGGSGSKLLGATRQIFYEAGVKDAAEAKKRAKVKVKKAAEEFGMLECECIGIPEIGQLRRLMASYVPEFSYSPESDDPGSVLTTLCADMIADSEKRFGQVLNKYKVQYLNLFEGLKQEPVSAAKGYVQFSPVAGYEGDIMVPAATQVMCAGAKQGEIIFETMHDMSVTAAEPELIVMTDRGKDYIGKISCQEKKQELWKAFDIQGENQARHILYLCFDKVFDYLNRLDFHLHIEMNNGEMQQEYMELLASQKVSWSIMDENGELHPFDTVVAEEGGLHFVKEDLIPQKSSLYQKEGYFLVLEEKEELPDLYISRITLEMTREKILPEKLLVNGISAPIGSVHPFGKPLQLYQEFVIVSGEAFTKKGARITLDFELDYDIYEENLEIPETDLEYKVIMKKPKKALEIQAAQVFADYVVWEYLSRTGWKQIWREEHIAVMFHGNQEGHMTLSFLCPEDMEDDPELIRQGTVRARLMRAENIYKVPAVYKCPRITGLNLSYAYEKERLPADYAMIKNSFEEQDVTKELASGTAVKVFYNSENERRCMYLGFSAPVSIYFDLENYNDVPIDFTVEYMSPRGFVRIKNVDGTDGFLGSGNMLLMIPGDMRETTLYGYKGYFLRFVNYNHEIKEYALPVVKGIYMNMAKVINTNIVTEEFYLEDLEHSTDIQLSQENLIQAEVWGRERHGEQEEWVLWESRPGFSTEGRNYKLDMVQGILHLDKQVLANAQLSQQGPHFMVKHCNYTGSQANLEAGAIDTLRNSVRYISSVTNPFPTYGGYDGYTRQSAQKLVPSMLYTRNRAVSAGDYYHVISQISFGVRRVKCASNVDIQGNPKNGTVTVAVLIEEYEKGMQIFSELKEEIRRKLLETGNLVPTGKELLVTQPHFIRVSVRLWLEKKTMEQAYELQQEALTAIRKFIDPLDGGIRQNGWEIGDFPRQSQLVSYLRTRLSNCEISRMVMTAMVDGTEVTVTDEFYAKLKNPFVLAVNGEHVVYIDIV